MKKVSEEELISMILELRRAISVVKFSIPKSSMYDKTSALCDQVNTSSKKLLERYYGGLLLETEYGKFRSMLVSESIDRLRKAGINMEDAISSIGVPKPRYCPYCNKPIIGKITKIYCSENHRYKYLKAKQS